ncbi:MAG TPA: response regulator [Cytophagaceae bacterium]|nr:response regulator [Cytophagaceae bacterium]
MTNNNPILEILLVEDNMSDAEMTIRALTKNNISNRIIHLKNGAEALDFLLGTGPYKERDIEIKPKVILLDLKMPKVGGIEVLRKIKSIENTRKIPVVVLTSSKEDPDISECYELGVNSYIVKPVGFENFNKAVTDLGMYWALFNEPPRQ